VKKIFIFLFCAAMSGCATNQMTASSTCTFTPSTKEGRYTAWISPGDAKCVFTLNSPIENAEDTKTFSDAFKGMMGSSPQIVVDK
jgi:hypothetical protein